MSGYINRSGILKHELKEQSFYLAYSCIDLAKYRFEDDLDYEGNETITIGDGSCKILPVELNGLNSIVTTQASTSHHFTKLQMTINELLAPVSFKEL